LKRIITVTAIQKTSIRPQGLIQEASLAWARARQINMMKA